MTAPEYTETELDDAMASDPEAPYGRRLDGTPKKAPGGRPAGVAGKRARRGTTRPSGTTAPAPRAANRSKRSTKADYRPGIEGAFSILALPLRFVSPLDAAAVLMHAKPVADAVNETAQDRPEIAALCDKLLQVGPYGLIISAFMGLGAQIAENHSLLPPEVTSKFGAIPRDQLAAHMGARIAEQEAAEAAEDAPNPYVTEQAVA